VRWAGVEPAFFPTQAHSSGTKPIPGLCGFSRASRFPCCRTATQRNDTIGGPQEKSRPSMSFFYTREESVSGHPRAEAPQAGPAGSREGPRGLTAWPPTGCPGPGVRRQGGPAEPGPADPGFRAVRLQFFSSSGTFFRRKCFCPKDLLQI
jgi:hypothetical protein